MSLTFERKRKIWHFILSTFALLSIYFSFHFLGIELTRYIAVTALAVSLFLDYLRVELNKKLPIYLYVMRDKESHRICGLTFSMIAIVIVLALFDFSIAFPALAMAFYGDMMAALIGKQYGVHTLIFGKTVEGSLACLFTTIAIALLFGYFLFGSYLLLVAMAIISTLVELLTNHLDDNFSIPFLTGFFGFLLSFII